MQVFRITNYITVLVLFVCLLMPTMVSASDIITEKIILKSGKSYIGEVILQNEEVIILKISDGSRFQFKLSDIEEISKVTSEQVKQEIDSPKELDAFLSGIVELSGGVSGAKFKTGAVPFSNLNITFGSDQFGDGTFYFGLGTGYFGVFIPSPDKTISFIPVFIKGRKTFSRRITSPYLALDLGYAFASVVDYKGGIYSKMNLGIQKRLSYKTTISGGIYAGASGYDGQLTEANNNGNFSFMGQTAFVSGGLSFGIQF